MASRTLLLPLSSIPSTAPRASSSSSPSNFPATSSSNYSPPLLGRGRNPGTLSSSPRIPSHVVRMAPDEEKITRRSPLDFPIEWERPKPGRRPDIFPQFAPMKTPLPMPMPEDPPFQDDEEEEPEQEEQEEEDPNKEEEGEENK